ncbi:MAG: peptidylprolyl isomerase [Hyphomonadaceae bacterium]|nr:peptidylprolyl isomerase [Hyphomonadaceae bacterium]
MRPFFVAFLALGLALAAAPAAFAQRPPDPERWRALDLENTLYIDTTKGRIVIEMYPEVAPQHVERVKTLARARFYDGQTFFRVIDGFMAQTGDPLNSGEGASQLPDLQQEFLFRRGADMPFVEASFRGGARQGFYKTLPIETQPDSQMRVTRDQRVSAWGLHCAGVAAMARAEDPNSANSQFFITRAPYPSLDKRYTVWGRVVFGQSTVNAIQVGEPPENPDRMTAVRVAADLPETERAPLYVMRTDGRDFRELINEVRNARRADFSVCDVEIPARVPQDRRERRWWSIIPFIP